MVNVARQWSGYAFLHDLGNNRGKLVPTLLFGFELLSAGTCQRIILRLTVVVRLRPSGLNPTLGFHAVEGWVNRAFP